MPIIREKQSITIPGVNSLSKLKGKIIISSNEYVVTAKPIKDPTIETTSMRENTEGRIIENAFKASSNNVNMFAELLPSFRGSILYETYSAFPFNCDR
jgi:hypothetical protein